MDKYVFHLDFHVVYMDDMDIILGYPWMELVGTTNINVKNKFLELWYQKNKIVLQDLSLTKIEGPKGELKKVHAWKILAITIDTLDEEFEFDLEEEPAKSHE